MQLHTTTHFPGLCDEAISFYQNALQAELLYLHRVGERIDAHLVTPGTENKVLRAALRIGQSVIYLSDGHRPGPPGFQGFSLSLSVDSRADAERLIDALAEGGRVQVALRQSVWAGLYAALVDRYGMHWTVEVPPAWAMKNAVGRKPDGIVS